MRGSVTTPTLVAYVWNHMIFHFLHKIQLPLMGPLTRGSSLEGHSQLPDYIGFS